MLFNLAVELRDIDQGCCEVPFRKRTVTDGQLIFSTDLGSADLLSKNMGGSEGSVLNL